MLEFHLPLQLDPASVSEFLRSLSSVVLQEVITKATFPADERPYGRNLVYRSLSAEVLAMGWGIGRECPPHDHGRAEGLVLVCQGVARHKIFRSDLTLISDTLEPTGSTLGAPHNCIHAMGSAASGEPLITLHVYWPPIDRMAIFDTDRGLVYIVSDRAGAWLPPDPATLIETRVL